MNKPKWKMTNCHCWWRFKHLWLPCAGMMSTQCSGTSAGTKFQVMFVGFLTWTACFMSFHNISSGLMSRLGQNWTNNLGGSVPIVMLHQNEMYNLSSDLYEYLFNVQYKLLFCNISFNFIWRDTFLPFRSVPLQRSSFFTVDVWQGAVKWYSGIT